MFSILLVTSFLLLLFYFCCSTITITTTTTIVTQLLLIPLCKQVFISGAVELTTQLSKPVRILCVPECRINKLGYLAREDYLDALQLRVISKLTCVRKDALGKGRAKGRDDGEASTSRVANSNENGADLVNATRKTKSVGLHINPLIKGGDSQVVPNQFPLAFGSFDQEGSPSINGGQKSAARVASQQRINVHVPRSTHSGIKSLAPGTQPGHRWCPLGLTHTQKPRVQRLRAQELQEQTAEKSNLIRGSQ